MIWYFNVSYLCLSEKMQFNWSNVLLKNLQKRLHYENAFGSSNNDYMAHSRRILK